MTYETILNKQKINNVFKMISIVFIEPKYDSLKPKNTGQKELMEINTLADEYLRFSNME